MNEIKVNLENLTEEERENLIALIEKANNPSKVWKPEKDEKYYFISGNGIIIADISAERSVDDNRYAFGNCFKTEEEAKFAREKLKVIAELKRLAEENNEYEIDWKDPKQEKYILYYYHEDNRVYFNSFASAQNDNIVFTSAKIAQKAIKTIGEARLKKYYFEVE